MGRSGVEAVSLAAALERAACALEPDAERIRPANGDPARLRRDLPPEAGGRVLAWLLAHEPEAGEELAEAWSEDPEGVPHLLAVSEAALPKAARKALRRVMHRLRGRGVSIPEAAPPPVVVTLPPSDDALDVALLSPLDPSGARIAYLVESHPGGGARIFELILDPSRGVLECSVYTAGRSGARKFLREAEARKGFPGIAVAPDSLRRLVARCAEAQASDRPLPRTFVEWRTRLTQTPPEAGTPGELARKALGSEGGGLPRALELVREGQLGPWPPQEAPLRALVERLQELAGGRIVVSPGQKRERIDALLSEVLSELYQPPEGERMAGRFEEMAFVLWKQGREEDARACLAAARSFGDTPGGENAVARALIEVALAPLLDRLREEEDSSLIVKP
jgi:hypothetical protein